MKKQPTAKTPTVAIARVLRNLGLKQGEDFRVKGEYRGSRLTCTNTQPQLVSGWGCTVSGDCVLLSL